MEKIRDRIEARFEQWARWVFENRYKTFVFMMVAIGILLSNLPQITIDTSTEGFLRDDDPALLAYNDFRDQFGRDEMVIVAIKPDDVFDIGFLKKLKALHNELEEKVPHLDDITSLINARNTRGEGDELIVEDLLENFPANDDDVAKIKKRTLSNPMYKNLLISEDGKFTTIVIKTDAYSSEGENVDMLAGFNEGAGPISQEGESERKFLTDAENTEMVTAVRDVIARYDGDDFPIILAGSPVFTNDLKKSMMKDMRKFMVMAIIAISLLLFAMFRRVSGVVMPLFVVIVSLLSTVSVMAIAGTAIKLPTQILPSFLLAVGVGDSVHILAIFYYRLQKGDGKEDAIAYAMGHSGLAVL
ncbi:Exporter protein, RND family, partial [hydrothermal vent metagenome]